MLTKSQRRSLAHAVAATGSGRPLRPDNTAGAPADLDDLVEGGGPFFLTPRADLLVVDLDLAPSVAESNRRARRFDELLGAAKTFGVAHVVTESGSAGHRHAYLLTGTGVVRTLLALWCADHGLDVRDRGIRPPGTPHRCAGTTASLTEPATAAYALAVLHSTCDPDAVADMTRRNCGIRLSQRIRDAVDDPHRWGVYPSASEVRMALADSLYAQGAGRELLTRLLDHAGGRTCEAWALKHVRERQVELDRIWTKAAAFVGSQTTTLAEVELWRQALAGGRWAGESGANTLAVAEASGSIATRVRRIRIAAALEDLATEAGVSVATARRAVNVLCDDGWLRVTAGQTAMLAREYALTVPAHAGEVEAPRWWIPRGTSRLLPTVSVAEDIVVSMCARCRERAAVWQLPLGPSICDECYIGLARTSGLATRLGSIEGQPEVPSAGAAD